jgi:hypothetical protein
MARVLRHAAIAFYPLQPSDLPRFLYEFEASTSIIRKRRHLDPVGQSLVFQQEAGRQRSVLREDSSGQIERLGNYRQVLLLK